MMKFIKTKKADFLDSDISCPICGSHQLISVEKDSDSKKKRNANTKYSGA